MKLQYRLQNGRWVDLTSTEHANHMVNLVLERESWFAPRVNRESMTTREQVLAYLVTGKTLKYADDWYADLRDGDSIPLRPKPQPVPEKLCDCGHYSAHPMNTSRGTSCPNCYDEMSE